MNRIVITLLLAVISLPALAAETDKVDICHFDLDYGVWKLVSISGNAVEAHFENHDDGLPDGEPTLGTGTELDENCEIVTNACPCFTEEEASAIADGEVTYCSFHPTETTWASLAGKDASTGAEESMHTAANPTDYWQRCSFDAVGYTAIPHLGYLTLEEVAACYTIITNLIAAKGLEPVSGSNVCQPFK